MTSSSPVDHAIPTIGLLTQPKDGLNSISLNTGGGGPSIRNVCERIIQHTTFE